MQMTYEDHTRTIMEIFSLTAGEDWQSQTPTEIAHALAFQVKNDRLLFDLKGVSEWTANMVGLDVPPVGPTLD